MTTQERHYFAEHVAREEESERLNNLQLAADPLTTKRLEAVGIAPGWNCLEVGAGQGSMAAWMADRVGPDGRVVALDIDLRLLGHLEDLSNVEVRECNILSGDLEENHYDLAHTRFVLMHLSDPERALERMVESLRPGGWILVEDPVFYEAITLTPNHPAAETYLRTVNVWRLCAEDAMELNFGRKILRMVAKMGLVDFEAETTQRACCRAWRSSTTRCSRRAAFLRTTWTSSPPRRKIRRSSVPSRSSAARGHASRRAGPNRKVRV